VLVKRRLTRDEVRQIAADAIGAQTSTQIDCVLVRIVLAEVERLTEKASAESDKQH
jgi:hypothetical protein